MNTENLTLSVTCPSCGSVLTLNNNVDSWRQQVKTCIMPYCNECHHMWPLSEDAKEELKKTLEAKV